MVSPPTGPALFKSMVESAPCYFYVADPSDASTVYRSPQAIPMLGWSLADWDDDPGHWAQILHPDDRERVLAEMAAAINGGKPFRTKYRIRTASDVYLWVRDHGTLIANPSGPGMIFQGVVLDITEEMEGVQAARRVEDRLGVLLRSAPVLLFSLTPAGVITAAGGSGLAEFGLGPDHGIGSSVFEVFADQPEIVGAFQRALTGRELSGELYHKRLDRWFAASTTPVFEDGEMVAVTVVATDITERRGFEKARFVSDAKSRALASISHELRTPLNSILGFSQLLQDGSIAGPLNDRQRRYVDNVWKSGDHLLDLVNDVLDLARSESGKAELEIEPVVLETAVALAVAALRTAAEAKALTLTLEMTAGIVVQADATSLNQILRNLLSNAIKFTDHGGVVISSKKGDGGRIALTVADTGIGISSADQAGIFEEFVQLGSDWAGGTPGTGLGLSLTRSYVEAMGGSITTDSQPGRGSRFTVLLPGVWPET